MTEEANQLPSTIKKPKSKGRKHTEFSEDAILNVLEKIRDKVDLSVSAYHINSVFINKLHFVDYSLEKVNSGRGRRRKVYFLTPEGEKFLEDKRKGNNVQSMV